MIDDFQVPDEFLGAFRRLVRRMPVELQTDDAFLQTLVMYLKLGGEKLASHRIEVEKTKFVTAFTLVKRQPHEETSDTKSGDDDEAGDDNGDEAGDDNGDEVGDDNGDEVGDDHGDEEDAVSHSDKVEDVDPDTIVS